MQYTDIFFFNPIKSSDNNYTLECNNNIDNFNLGNVKDKKEYVVYIYKNMYLTIQTSKNNNKICERIETDNYSIKGNKMFVNIKITNIHIDSFPLINNYHSIIKRKITTYDNNIEVIEDATNKGCVSFLRVKNDIENSNKLINQISLG
jgi:hypothetical protein